MALLFGRWCCVQRWGQPRATKDVDLCILTALGNERPYIDALLLHFAARREDAADFAEQNRVVLIQAANGVGVDVALGWLPFEEQMLERATLFKLEKDVNVFTASAEDLVVTKVFAGRGLDWVDVERILARQRGKLDWDYIFRELRELGQLKEDTDMIDMLQRLKLKIDVE